MMFFSCWAVNFKSSSLRLLTGFLLSFLSLWVHADKYPITFHSLGLQYSNVDIIDDHSRDISIDSYDDLSFVYEGQFSPKLSLILSTSIAEPENNAAVIDAELSSYNMGFRRYFYTSTNPWRQFAGLGLRRVEIESSDSVNVIEENGFYGEAGIQGVLGRRLLAEAGVRLHTSTKNGIIEAAPFVGLRILLGAEYPAEMKAAEKVEIIPPPLDDDNDGVINGNDACPQTLPRAVVDSRGCGLTQTLVLRETLYVTFNSGSAVVDVEAATDVLPVVKLLNAYPETQITLVGHTDSVGSIRANLNLSIARSAAVKGLLVREFNILPSRILIRGEGESKPIASNESLEGRAANRRVEAFIEVQKTETRFKPVELQDVQSVATE